MQEWAELLDRLGKLSLCQSRLLPGELWQKPFSGVFTALGILPRLNARPVLVTLTRLQTDLLNLR